MADKAPKKKNSAAHDPHRVIAQVAPYLRIAHQVAGRVRIKLQFTALDATALSRGEGLTRTFGALPGVRAISLNPLALSCVVEYDNAVIPDAAWPDLLAGRRTAAAETLLGLLASVAPASIHSSEKENA
ncbi:MAG: hypothetical protein PHS77_07235 [Gallionellaceae bacterium]|nr:hypothetical protein [Gallionellaceae bacterium]